MFCWPPLAPLGNHPLQAIKVASGGGDAEREAVREAVRRQRRKVARSLSQEDRRTEASSEGTAATGEDELGSLVMEKIPRSSVSSLSPWARQHNEWHARYGSSQSELKFAEGGGGGGGGGSLAASSRMASGMSDARLTSASTLSSFNGESMVSAMPSAGAEGWAGAIFSQDVTSIVSCFCVAVNALAQGAPEVDTRKRC